MNKIFVSQSEFIIRDYLSMTSSILVSFPYQMINGWYVIDKLTITSLLDNPPEMKILFEKIPDFKTTLQEVILYVLTKHILHLTEKGNSLNEELAKENTAAKVWNESYTQVINIFHKISTFNCIIAMPRRAALGWRVVGTCASTAAPSATRTITTPGSR